MQLLKIQANNEGNDDTLKPRSIRGGNANAQNPGQQPRGMTILRTPVILHGECNGSKPRATNEGNDDPQNPGHFAWGMQMRKTPGNNQGE